MSDQATGSLLDTTTQIVVAHLSNNMVDAQAIPALIQSVFQTLSSVGQPDSAPAVTQPPAVPIKKSVFPDFIVCLEDGRKLKMLKRHLKTSYDMTPEAYRTKWGLPPDYPMVAPNYASKRSTLAKQSGLGRRNPEETPDEPATTQLPARRARGSRG